MSIIKTKAVLRKFRKEGAMPSKETLSTISGILMMLAFVPYIIGIVRGNKVSKASWIIWPTMDTITLAGMYKAHSLNGQIIGAVVGAWIVCGFAMKYGEWKKWKEWPKTDKWCLLGAALGIALLKINPSFSII